MEESRRTRHEQRPSTTTGAGPSRTRSPIRPPITRLARRPPSPPPVSQPMRRHMPPPQYSPPQRRRQSPPPSPGQDTSPRQRQRRLSTGNPNRDVRIHTNRPNSEWPDPTRIQPRAMAHIPIPATRHGDPRESVTNVPTAQGATDIHEANTYEQLWPLFESGALTVPDTFTRLYLTDRTNNLVHFIRSAAMGFATSRRIMQAANVS